ncbi:MAG: HpcH/HpaI aldolase/citrate lyase family protein [Dehalococcoidia bacterium]
MRKNKIKAMWREGKPAVICWVGIADTYVAETLAHAGFDALVLDMQHGMGIGPDRAAQWLQTVSTTDTVPMVRVPWNEPVYPQWVLDAGAYGVVVPLVNNKEEAAKAGMSCRYPPIGFRSIGPNRANYYAGSDYTQHANDEIVCLVMVESIDTIPNLEEMAQAPGIDGFYIGPADLALSMGVPPTDYRKSDEHAKACQNVLDVAKAHNLVAGVHCRSPEEALDRFRQGFMMCPAAADAALLATSARAAVEKVRKPEAEGAKPFY